MKARIDAWLWSVRVYKTRSEATTACRAGHIRVNGDPVKAAFTIKPGDNVRIRRHGFDRHLQVVKPLVKRVSAQVAATAYIDHTPERVKPALPLVPVRPRGSGRPTKKERRQMDQLRASWVPSVENIEELDLS